MSSWIGVRLHPLSKEIEMVSTSERKGPVPILIVCYARPASTALVLEKIFDQRPGAQVYVALDGPKTLADARILRLRREVVEVVNRFASRLNITFVDRQQNVGTNRNIEDAIQTVFLNHDRVIVVEDDCIPNASFFDFCEWGLSYFHSDSRILMIQGANHFRWPVNSMRGNYILSQLSHVWGWATWREKWEDPSESNRNLRSTNREEIFSLLRRRLPFIRYRKAWLHFFDSEREASWDISLQFKIWREGLLVVSPGVNLVSNVGFDGVASNSNLVPDHFQNPSESQLHFPLKERKIPIRMLTLLEMWSLRRFAISRGLRLLISDLRIKSHRRWN